MSFQKAPSNKQPLGKTLGTENIGGANDIGKHSWHEEIEIQRPNWGHKVPRTDT